MISINASQMFMYGCTYRPPSFATVPKGWVNPKPNPFFNHGTIEYDRELTEHEIKSFELTPIVTVVDQAKSIAETMSDYAKEYLEFDETEFKSEVQSRIQQTGVWSTSNVDALSHAVRRELSKHVRSFAGAGTTMTMPNARMLRFAIRLVSSSIDSHELELEEARIDIDKPYKPRKLKPDQSHQLMREAYKRRPQDSARDAKEKRTREKWTQDNEPDLKRRSEFVRKQKKLYGYD